MHTGREWRQRGASKGQELEEELAGGQVLGDPGYSRGTNL